MYIRYAFAFVLGVAIVILLDVIGRLTNRCRTCKYYDCKTRLCEHPYCIYQYTVMDEHDTCGFYERKEEEK